jgi:predicted Fe-Mo cluster-binding NifX family protein
MKVAMPIWDERVSPVMDTACRLLIAEIVEGREVSRTIVDIPQADIPHRAAFLSSLGINILICGAISQQFEQIIAASGIKMHPWYCGRGNEIIAAYSNGTLQNGDFLSPGCRRQQRRRGRGRSRAGYSGSGRKRSL